MKLIKAIIGNSYEVLSINTVSETERRLETLGMTEGSKLDVLGKKRNGTVIIKSRGTRFALGGKIAEGIEIRGVD